MLCYQASTMLSQTGIHTVHCTEYLYVRVQVQYKYLQTSHRVYLFNMPVSTSTVLVRYEYRVPARLYSSGTFCIANIRVQYPQTILSYFVWNEICTCTVRVQYEYSTNYRYLSGIYTTVLCTAYFLKEYVKVKILLSVIITRGTTVLVRYEQQSYNTCNVGYLYRTCTRQTRLY